MLCICKSPPLLPPSVCCDGWESRAAIQRAESTTYVLLGSACSGMARGTQDGFDATACTSHGGRSRNTLGGIWSHPHGATMVGRIDMGWVRDSAY